jgi:hypothetical protein
MQQDAAQACSKTLSIPDDLALSLLADAVL